MIVNYFPIISSFIVLSLLCFITSGCSSSRNFSSSIDTSSIPEKAIEVLLHSESNPDDYIAYIRRRLETLGFNIDTYNPLVHEIWTAGENFSGRSLVVKVTTSFDATYLTTIARLSGRFSTERTVNPTFESEIDLKAFAYWNTNNDKHARAFLRLVEIAQMIDHELLDYAVVQ